MSNVTIDWFNVVSGVSVASPNSGVLFAIEAVSYQYGIKSWNESYMLQWCSANRPNDAISNYLCNWDYEPVSASNRTAIIRRTYCGSNTFPFPSL